MKILSCSDVHLTNYSAFNQPTEHKEIGSRLEKILKALDYFFEYGVKHKITKFVINGDLFDQRQRDNPTTLASIRYYLIEHFKHLEVANNEPYELYINVGNHDEFGRTSYPNAIQDFELYSDNQHKIYVFNDISMKCFDDSNLFFIPYSEHVDELKAGIKKSLKKWNNNKPITVFAHLGVTGGVQGRWHHRLSDAFNVYDLGWNNPNVRSIVLGHFHTKSTLYPNVKERVVLPSDTPSKHNTISLSTINTIEYNLKYLNLQVNYDKGLVKNRNVYSDPDGYMRVSLKDNINKYHSINVAHIIAYLKYGKDKLLGKQIDHINNKHGLYDNYPSNLQILSAKDNLKKEMSDNNKRIACKAKNYFTGTEIFAHSIYELSLRIKVSVSSISKCVQHKASLAGDFFVAPVNNSYNYDIGFNHFSIQGMKLDDNSYTPVFNVLADAERWLGLSVGNSNIGSVCRHRRKSCYGYTWWYVPKHPEVYYQGDLTELNFNDIQANGLGAPRGFDKIDTVTGKHKFIDLTKYADYPDNIPTFNLIDLDNPNQKVDYLNLLKQGNYLKLITKSKDTYDKVNQVIQKQPLSFNAQLVYQPEIKEQTDFKVQANSSSKELVAEYCKQHYPELKKQALNYLERASNQ